jgi:hypothetical protein
MGIPNGTGIWPWPRPRKMVTPNSSFRTTRDLLVEWKGIWIPDTHCQLLLSSLAPSSYPFNFFTIISSFLSHWSTLNFPLLTSGSDNFT